MARNYLTLTLRILSILLLVFVIFLLGTIYNNEIFNIWDVLGILGDLRDIFAFVLYIILFAIFTGIFYGFGFALQYIIPAPYFNLNYFFQYASHVFSSVVGRWFYFGKAFQEKYSETPSLLNAWGGLKDIFLAMTDYIYIIILQILVIIMIFNALRASITSNPGDSITVVIIINLIIIIPLFITQLNSVIQSLFGITSANFPPFIQKILTTNNTLIYPDLLLDIREITFFEFLGSKVFIVALFMFVYLEFVFQLAYVDKVTKPSIEREARLSRQIELMHFESEKAVARIKAMEESRRLKKQEERVKRSEEQREREKKEKERLSLRSFMAEKAEVVGFSYVSELIAKKKQEKVEQREMDTMKDTRRVANYLDKLFLQDPEARASLTAKTSAPKATRLVVSTIINMLTRMLIVTLIAWACVHPYDVFVYIFRAPPAIAESVELQTYEAVLSLLIPIILIIPLISSIIRIAKQSKLDEMLRLEELQRAGLTEEELAAIEVRRQQMVGTEEVGLSRDQDALAEQTRKAAQAQPGSVTPPNP